MRNSTAQYDIAVLSALLRLARRRVPATLDQLVVRTGGEERDVRAALARLTRKDLVERRAAASRLTMTGFLIAVACAGHLSSRGRHAPPSNSSRPTPQKSAVFGRPHTHAGPPLRVGKFTEPRLAATAGS